MSKHIAIKEIDSNTAEAISLINDLSDTLEAITGSSGRSSFEPSDVCGHRATFVLAYNENGEAVGCGAIRPIDENTAEVKRMFAKEKGRGIGTKVLSFLEAKAQELGYATLRLETRFVNQRAVEFYENKGYRRISNYGKYVSRPEAVCFEKNLCIEKVKIQEIINDSIKGFTFTNRIETDYYDFFKHHGKQDVAEHFHI